MLKHDSSRTAEIREKYRPPSVVMRLERMGSAHQGRLSFMRTLLRRLKNEQWKFKRSQFEINEKGVGFAVYQAIGPVRTYSLVAFAHDLPNQLRSDRVIAHAWDSTFCLFDGIPTSQDIERLSHNVPKQEAGRVSSTEISLSRANRSARLFNNICDLLAQGFQPEREMLESVGYVMRTTAVYGSGKFGAADRQAISERAEVSGPFQAEMLSVWLTRAYTADLVEHMAQVKGGDKAVVMEPELRRCLGVGNSTGLGMAPFIINHPRLLNNWITAREEALARVRAVEKCDDKIWRTFKKYVQRAAINAQQWQSQHPLQIIKITAIQADFDVLDDHIAKFDHSALYPWDHLYVWAEKHLSIEGQEQLSMLMLEPYPELVDDLTDCMTADESYLPMIDGKQTVHELISLLESDCDWALNPDYSKEEHCARFWYVSEEKLEPRVGERFDEPGSELELPLCVSWHIDSLYNSLKSYSPQSSIAEFSMANPQHRHIIRRVQQIRLYPYMEIHDNLISKQMLPIDLLRLKLSFFGATRFDPRSDRWVRINMFQYAPYPHELDTLSADDWVYPPLPGSLS